MDSSIPFWTVGIWQDNRGFELPVTRSRNQSDLDGKESWTKREWSSVGPCIYTWRHEVWTARWIGWMHRHGNIIQEPEAR